MSKIEKVPFVPGQPPKDAEAIEILDSQEPWTVIKLADGTILRLKSVITEVWRAINEFDDEGKPMYSVRANGMLVVDAPQSLKARKN